MIISASRRTDIPALYAPWFRHRLEAGWCEVPNPYRPTQVSRVSLLPEDVDAIVFWTRHARPLYDVLPLLEARAIPCCFQYTITGYGPPVETRTPSLTAALTTFRELAERVPSGAVVWRYDPILLGEAFPASEHVRRFGGIARALEGATRRVVLSVFDTYQRTRRRLRAIYDEDHAVAREPLEWPGLDDLLSRLAATARDHGMTPEACAEPLDLGHLGIEPTKCIDDRLLTDLFGGTWPRTKDRGQRPSCRCIPSKDIGIPDTCTLGCAYCYATRSDDLARRRRAMHDETAPCMA